MARRRRKMPPVQRRRNTPAMSTPEQRAKWALEARERWHSMPADKKARVLAKRREYSRLRYARLQRLAQPTQPKAFRRIDFNKNERYQYVLQMKFEREECHDCGWKVSLWNHAAMEWDHRNPSDKEFTLSSAWKIGNMSRDKLRAEAEKCDLVCANCHRIRTYWSRDHDAPAQPAEHHDDQLRLFDA